MRRSKLELAWAAGFFDGEGCFTVKGGGKDKKVMYLSICVAQVDPRPLRRFAALFGLKVYGPYGPSGKRRSRAYMLHTRSQNAIEVARALLPHLCEPKKESLAAAIDRCLESRRPDMRRCGPIAGDLRALKADLAAI